VLPLNEKKERKSKLRYQLGGGGGAMTNDTLI
jgi:hypothetical protein